MVEPDHVCLLRFVPENTLCGAGTNGNKEQLSKEGKKENKNKTPLWKGAECMLISQ